LHKERKQIFCIMPIYGGQVECEFICVGSTATSSHSAGPLKNGFGTVGLMIADVGLMTTVECWIDDRGFWIDDRKFWIDDCGFRIDDCGYWILDFGF
ncbi:MAG: hypothetical protein ACYTX0_48950, partial [Nostoc sp.]